MSKGQQTAKEDNILEKNELFDMPLWARGLIFSSPGEVSWNFEDCSEINDGKDSFSTGAPSRRSECSLM